MLSYIWAEDTEHHIGKNGSLPWNLPADLAYFKKMTRNHPIVMGRKTFNSFPDFLPGRLHVVLTHSQELQKQAQNDTRLEVVSSKEELFDWISLHNDEDIFVIGGSTLFSLLKNKVERLYQTKITGDFMGDVCMPELDYTNFDLTSVVSGKIDEKNKFPYEFRIYDRKKI